MPIIRRRKAEHPFWWAYLSFVERVIINKIEAVNLAINREFPSGIQEAEIELNSMSDNGSQPTSRAFMETCAGLEIKQAFTAYNNPKGNADIKRMMRTLKEELCWLQEWQSAAGLKRRLILSSSTSMMVICIRHLAIKHRMRLRRNILKTGRRLSIWRLD